MKRAHVTAWVALPALGAMSMATACQVVIGTIGGDQIQYCDDAGPDGLPTNPACESPPPLDGGPPLPDGGPPSDAAPAEAGVDGG